MSRVPDIARFYDLIADLRDRIAGPYMLQDFKSLPPLPARGVYFFFEAGEARQESGTGPRIVRVGTHGLTTGSRSTLKQRLGQHRGSSKGGGHHRTSIFRLLTGGAMQARGDFPKCVSWGVKGDHGKAAEALGIERRALVDTEAPIEAAVTAYIASMPFLWLDIPDDPGPHSHRGLIERNSIALLSNLNREPIDASSDTWLGQFSDRPLVRGSGLWNQRHVDEDHDPEFLGALSALIGQMK
jgi:hypothetical protein